MTPPPTTQDLLLALELRSLAIQFCARERPAGLADDAYAQWVMQEFPAQLENALKEVLFAHAKIETLRAAAPALTGTTPASGADVVGYDPL